jgi:hypothetical protein
VDASSPVLAVDAAKARAVVHELSNAAEIILMNWWALQESLREGLPEGDQQLVIAKDIDQGVHRLAVGLDRLKRLLNQT